MTKEYQTIQFTRCYYNALVGTNVMMPKNDEPRRISVLPGSRIKIHRRDRTPVKFRYPVSIRWCIPYLSFVLS
ncbi:hypothetical protein T265_04414 [Opisthorchis viverrini]|uniref:Uncharacterized protein n=1 Tax=Opisthorchis viverrini TaxID=6198 RepID=A0A074ZZT1_OPIVI|nr:hypothetical protein T265_04414 [Opisthorchis viverrini]KER28805.1 hypothetical protein T265_04414 [Opisthorchis viverrini]